MLGRNRTSSQTCSTPYQSKSVTAGRLAMCRVNVCGTKYVIGEPCSGQQTSDKGSVSGNTAISLQALRLDDKSVSDVPVPLSREQFFSVPKSLNHLNSNYQPVHYIQRDRGSKHSFCYWCNVVFSAGLARQQATRCGLHNLVGRYPGRAPVFFWCPVTMNWRAKTLLFLPCKEDSSFYSH